MTIRRQMLLYVTPLFACFGLIGGTVAWRMLTVAAERMFEDESQALTVALAEFVAPADVTALATGTPVTETAFGRALPRLERWSLAKRIYVLDAVSGRVLSDTDVDAPRPEPSASRGLMPDEVRRLPMRSGPNGQQLQPLLTFTARNAAILGVEISAEPFLKTKADILNATRRNVIIAVVLGVIVALILAEVLGWQIRQLRRAAETIGRSDAAVEPTGGLLQEVADLGNTFGVMHSVLDETVSKTRRSLVENDFFRGERALTAVMQHAVDPARAWTGGGASAAWLGVGSPPPASFAGAVAFGADRGAAFVGVAGPAGQLRPALRAQAARAFLADALARRPLAAVAEEARTLFELSDLAVVFWQGKTLTRWSTVIHREPDEAAWATGETVPLACLGAGNRDRLALYLANFPDHLPAQALDELPPLLDGLEPGVILLLRRDRTDRGS